MAVMKQNIGVARAWNLGLEIAATPTVFIMNADLHVERPAIVSLEEALNSLPGAACVGPQGSFLNFSLTRDYIYFDKGGFNQALEVDAVSGFFFAVKSEHFNSKQIRFENGFTPCYFEEWDLGLQIKQAGLKSYIVPTTAYDHHWSGTIRALREIPYYERTETAGEILIRNRLLFLNKWRGIADREDNQLLLVSGFLTYAADMAQAQIAEGRFHEAGRWLSEASQRGGMSPRIDALQRFIDIQAFKSEKTICRKESSDT
jgi:GT2 family glycosyltransferase